jgi:tetrapyrrole methylase family protein/MazG family protein
MKRLRSKKGGCPWDRKQTHKTLLPYLLEESYELIEAINKRDKKGIKEELGDVLLQVVFHAQIAGEKDGFSIDDVVDGINEKLISRHPHVFAGKRE